MKDSPLSSMPPPPSHLPDLLRPIEPPKVEVTPGFGPDDPPFCGTPPGIAPKTEPKDETLLFVKPNNNPTDGPLGELLALPDAMKFPTDLGKGIGCTGFGGPEPASTAQDPSDLLPPVLTKGLEVLKEAVTEGFEALRKAAGADCHGFEGPAETEASPTLQDLGDGLKNGLSAVKEAATEGFEALRKAVGGEGPAKPAVTPIEMPDVTTVEGRQEMQQKFGVIVD